MAIKVKTKILISCALILLVAAGGAIYYWHEENRPRIFEMYVFNMKSGHSIFIRTSNDKRILIDGGANSDIIRRITAILPFYSRKIDMVIATDDSGREVSGLIDIISRYEVSQIFIPTINLESLGLTSSTDQIYKTFIQTAVEKGILITKVEEPEIINLEENAAIDTSDTALNDSIITQVMFPAASSTFTYSKTSAPELLLRFKYGSNSIVLLGNATPKIQKFIAAQGTTTADALIIWNNASSDNLAANLMNQLHLGYLVYSKSLTASNRATGTNAGSKAKTDPLAYIPAENRFNLKEFDFVKFTSDGYDLKVEGIK